MFQALLTAFNANSLEYCALDFRHMYVTLYTNTVVYV